MAEAASALLALWNDVDPARDAEYHAWHAVEHVPERLTVPGFLWARRYGRPRDGGLPPYLTLYGLRDAAVLDSVPYHRLLREPTPASRAMRPALTRLSRWVCALDVAADLDRGAQLAVWTSDARPDGAAALLARRLPDAAPLPWLQPGQEDAVAGRWLRCLGVEAAQAPAGATLYDRLPVG